MTLRESSEGILKVCEQIKQDLFWGSGSELSLAKTCWVKRVKQFNFDGGTASCPFPQA